MPVPPVSPIITPAAFDRIHPTEIPTSSDPSQQDLLNPASTFHTDSSPRSPLPMPPSELWHLSDSSLTTVSEAIRERALRHPNRIPRLRRPLARPQQQLSDDPPSLFEEVRRSSAHQYPWLDPPQQQQQQQYTQQQQQQQQQERPQSQQHFDSDRPIMHPPPPPPSQPPSYCIPEKAVDIASVCGDTVNLEPDVATPGLSLLDYRICSEDGGRYGNGPRYGIQNILRNDLSVYCSGREGAVNVLLKYSGWSLTGLQSDVCCTLSKVVIKAPQYGFTAPCKEGMIFVSKRPLNIGFLKKYDDWTKTQYEQFVEVNQHMNRTPDDYEPAAWFTLPRDGPAVVDLDNRFAKYVTIKLLRADYASDNIDLQYIGFVGRRGPQRFASGRLMC
ncbi:hypothetical protein BCR43DRAFT_558417 [Syncephalastrum racemosum]|uniref:Uncharacterized protein n=1 Tax=Syncephalastrum racemosum TaxID=13706 RepID=A0A1X2H4F6_SYNRA|nr:hypothetical protein BCR43DRAFT_558417 [Syncephalastrum racemosum]